MASIKGKTLVWKATNYGNAAVAVNIQPKDGLKFDQKQPWTSQTLTSAEGKDAQNTIDDPEHVAPVSGKGAVGAQGVSVELPAWSVIVVKVPLA